MSTTSATLLSAHNRILLAGLDPEPFTPTEQLLLAALVGGLPVPRGHLIQAAWDIELEQQDWHDRHALRVNVGRMRPKLAAQGCELVTRLTVGYVLRRGGGGGRG
jgi:DNA-binding response OmpR family regulator